MTEQEFYGHPTRLDSRQHPHWSTTCEWRAGRWDPMSNAPASTREIRGRDKDGKILEPMHFACDLSGEDQPAFRGWFVPSRDKDGRVLGFSEVQPVEWQPLTAQPEELTNG